LNRIAAGALQRPLEPGPQMESFEAVRIVVGVLISMEVAMLSLIALRG